MSRLCAKPTCGETAVSWLDILREDRRVIEQTRETAHGLALCAIHRERFVVPAGWQLQQVDTVSTGPELDAEVVTSTTAPEETAGNERSPSSERPWFLAATSSDAPVRPLLVADDDAETDDHSELTSGSLLRRAFQGPDRDDDRARRANADWPEESADVDARYDQETERTIRSLDEYGTAQLPFPPVDNEVQAAVS